MDYKPVMRPMVGQPLDNDYFTNLYESINSLSRNEIEYVVDSWASPWDTSLNNASPNSEISNTGNEMKIVTGIAAVDDGNTQRKAGQRGYTVSFPPGTSFTTPPVVIVTPVFNGNGAEPLAACVQKVTTKDFYVQIQSVNNTQIKVSHINYAAFGF